MNTYRIVGEIAEGTFPNERVVVFKDFTGEAVGVIVSAGQVREVDGKAAIEVRALDRKGGYTLVRLPGELLTSGRLVSVKDSQLERT